MSLNRALYYYSTSWRDISDYVLSISSLTYGVGRIDKGNVPKLKIILDANCPYYGTTNQWKLEIGSNYTLLKAPLDAIEDIGGYKIAVTLIDDFFVDMYKKLPLSITGEGDAASIAGEAITLKTINDFTIHYTTNQQELDAGGFSTRDGDNLYDGEGNTITISGGETAIRYRTRGAFRGEDQAGDLGQIYVSLRDVISDIVTSESKTLDVDFGDTESSGYAYEQNFVGADKIVWDCKIINGYLISLFSSTGYVKIRSHNLSTGNTVDTTSYASRDWDEGNDGVDFIAYQIFPDYRNNDLYIPGWHCASYDADAANNTYIFRIIKISVASDGSLSEGFDAQDTGGSDFWSWLLDPANRADFRGRAYRFDTATSHITGWDNLTWYCDEDLADVGKFRIILRKGSGSTDMFVIDPYLWNGGAAYDIYTYTLASTTGYLVPDWMNGCVVHLYLTGGNWEKDFYRVNQATLTAGYSVSGSGGTVHTDDDPVGHTRPTLGTWRESFYHDDTIPTASGTFYYHLPQVPNGMLVREGVYNQYIENKTDYLGNHYSHDVIYAGSAWDDSIDRALVWSTDTGTSPTYLYWDYHDYYTYRRMYLYQPYVYKNKTEQFLDAIVSNGFFYEQRNGNVRLFRVNGNGTNLGTFTDSKLLNKIELDGFTDFGQSYILKVLNREKTKESGDQTKDLKTIISEYGWFSMWQLDYFSDWTYQINNDQTGIELIADVEDFYSVTSTRMPLLGDEFTYSGTTYIIIDVSIDIENWTISVTGIEDAS